MTQIVTPRPMKKLYAKDVLLSINPMPCQMEQCGLETYFAIPLRFAVIELCPAHLFPLLRKGQHDRLFSVLGDVVYAASLQYVTLLFHKEQRCWHELSEVEQEQNPLAASLHSIFTQVPDEHIDAIPLCRLCEMLAAGNARSSFVAMGGKDFLVRTEAQKQ